MEDGSTICKTTGSHTWDRSILDTKILIMQGQVLQQMVHWSGLSCGVRRLRGGVMSFNELLSFDNTLRAIKDELMTWIGPRTISFEKRTT